jgi:hypothetical protein
MNRTDWQRDAGFSRKAVWWIAGTVVFSFAVAIVVMAIGPDLQDRRSTGPSTFSRTALGHHALVDFLEASDVEVSLSRTRQMFRGNAHTPVILAEPDPSVPAMRSYVRSMLEKAADRRAPLVIVVPKWHDTTQRDAADERQRVKDVALTDGAQVDKLLSDVSGVSLVRGSFDDGQQRLTCTTSWGEALDVELFAPQTIEVSSEYEPLVMTRQGVLAARKPSSNGRSWVYLIADPDLLNNHGLARADNAVVIARLVTHVLGARAVVIDEMVHGHGISRSFMAEMLHPPLLLIVLHVVLVFGLLLLAGRVRFGKPRLAPSRLAPGKMGLIDNTSKLLSFRGRVRDSLGRYLEETLLSVARHYHLPRDLAREALVSRLQEISRRRGVETNLVTLQAQVAALEERRGDVGAKCVSLAQKLHSWREEMTDGR